MSHQKRTLFQLADTAGDGTGDQDAIGDYSITPDEFYVQPATGEVLWVEHVLIAITDGAAMSGSLYGSDLVLTNGIEIQVINGNGDVREDITDGLPIIANPDLTRLGTVDELAFGSGDQGLQCAISFDQPIIVRSSERFTFLLSDDFSDLVHQYFTIMGSIDHEG